MIRHSLFKWKSAVIFAAVLANSLGPSFAGDSGFVIGPTPSWYVLGGLSGGATVAFDRVGGLAGAEVSVVRLNQGAYWGGYADASFAFGENAVYATVGPELGYKMVGIDGGVAIRAAGDAPGVGASGRIFAAVGLLSIYGRYVYIHDDVNAHSLQFGLIVKLPILSPIDKQGFQ